MPSASTAEMKRATLGSGDENNDEDFVESRRDLSEMV